MITTELVQSLGFVGVSVAASIAFGGLLSLSPVRRNLDAVTYTRVQQRFIKAVDGLMKAIYPISLIATLVAIVLVRHHSTVLGWTIAGFALLLGAFIDTMAFDLPLNKEFLGWSADTPPTTWQATRARWERVNMIRALLLAGAVVCLYLAALLG
jgi:hypothetical protein